MSKSIYEEAIGQLLKIQGRLSTNYDKFLEVKQALEQAQKHEEVVKKVIESISRAELSKFQIMSILSASIGVGNEYDDINLREFEKDEQINL